MRRKQINDFKNKKHFFIILFFSSIFIGFCSQLHTQTLVVQGKVTASRFPIQNAAVTFIDNADTTVRFSAQTDVSGNYEIGLIPSVASGPGEVPGDFSLSQSYPNPFSSSTAISYQLHKISEVQIAIYDVLGRQVRSFKLGVQAAGSHNILWDGRNDLGKRVASGIYFDRLQAGNDAKVGKMVFNSGLQGSAFLL